MGWLTRRGEKGLAGSFAGLAGDLSGDGSGLAVAELNE